MEHYGLDGGIESLGLVRDAVRQGLGAARVGVREYVGSGLRLDGEGIFCRVVRLVDAAGGAGERLPVTSADH